MTNTLIDSDALIETMLVATKSVFEMMLGVTVEQRASTAPVAPHPVCEVLSVVGLTGTYTGNAFLLCTDKTACEIAGKLLMADTCGINDEVLDAIGEVTNMIVGSVKNSLEPYHGQINMSVPTVIFGKNFGMHQAHSDLNVRLECESPAGEFSVTIALTKL